MKKKALLYMSVLLVFCAWFNLRAIINFKTHYVNCGEDFSFYSNSELPQDFDELLNDEYGTSDYSAVSGDFTLSLDTFKFNKHYIKYSWFERNLSHIEAELFIENNTKALVEIQSAIKAALYDSLGNEYEAYYGVCENYPKDSPLGYKAKITLFFYPLKKNTDFVDLKVNFGENEFLLENINIVL